MAYFKMDELDHPNRPAVISKFIVAEQKDFIVDNFVVQNGNGKVHQHFF